MAGNFQRQLARPFDWQIQPWLLISVCDPALSPGPFILVLAAGNWSGCGHTGALRERLDLTG
jgi:hypothetical protein